MPLPLLGAASSLLGGLGSIASPLAGMFGSDGPSSAATGPVSFGDVNVNAKAKTGTVVAWVLAVVAVVALAFVLIRNRRHK